MSNEKVIEASRNFVCLRLATYEDADEAKFLRQIFLRNGNLENTVFAILSPDAKRSLVRAGRGPKFRQPSQMADQMNRIVREQYPNAPKQAWSDTSLPTMKNLDLGLNVASCDGLPLVLIVTKNKANAKSANKQLLPLAWTDEFAGQAVFAIASADANLNAVNGLDRRNPAGVYFIAPDTFGMTGEVKGKLNNPSTMSADFRELLGSFEPPKKDHRQHVQSGFQLGLRWETAIPVTDQNALKAANRLWGTQ